MTKWFVYCQIVLPEQDTDTMPRIFERKPSVAPKPDLESHQQLSSSLSHSSTSSKNKKAMVQRRSSIMGMFFNFKKSFVGSSSKNRKKRHLDDNISDDVLIRRRETIDWSILEEHKPDLSFITPVKERARGPVGRRLPTRPSYSRRNTVANLPSDDFIEVNNFINNPDFTMDCAPPPVPPLLQNISQGFLEKYDNEDMIQVSSETLAELVSKVLILEETVDGLQNQLKFLVNNRCRCHDSHNNNY